MKNRSQLSPIHPNVQHEKRILVVIGTLELGGTEKHIAKIFPRLQDLGSYRISICALSRLGPLKSKFLASGVRVFGKDVRIRQNYKTPEKDSLLIRMKNLFLVLGRYVREIVLFYFAVFKFRPHIIHFYLPQAYITGGVASLLIPKIRRIMSRRSLNHYQEHVKYSKNIEFFLHKKMDVVTGNSRAVIGQLVEEGIPKEKLKLIYNGVSIRDVSTPMENISEKPLEIVCVANLIPYKGHVDLLEALARLPKNLSWHVTCVGGGAGYMEILVKEAAAKGIAENVTFTGSVIDPAQYLSRASVAVNCSHQEGFSNAILEYMAFGLAIVATDVGGNAEAIRDEVDGLIVASRDAGALNQALLRLFDGGLRKRLGENAAQRVAESFSLEVCLDQYDKMYRNLTVSSSLDQS